MVPNARALLALLPVVTFAFAAVALRPRGEADRPLAIIRAAVAVAAGTVLSVELLSAFHSLSGTAVLALWCLATAATGWLAWRHKPSGVTKNPATWWQFGLGAPSEGSDEGAARGERNTARSGDGATERAEQGAESATERAEQGARSVAESAEQGAESATESAEQAAGSAAEDATQGGTAAADGAARRGTTTASATRHATAAGAANSATRRGTAAAESDRERWIVRVLMAAVGVLALAELVLALASAPNNFDSNSYHLPKIEHWIADAGVGNFATAQAQQIILVPGAEYLLLQLRLLSGADGQLNLLQWAAGLLGALAVARCAGQLGAGRAGRWLAAAVFLTAPAVVLESTSTQNDLVVTAWVVCAATVALDARRRPATLADGLTLAGAAGLVMVTKSTGLMVLLPLLVYWAIGQLRQRQYRRMVYGGLAVAAACALLAGPSLLRVQDAFGSPLGPPDYRTGLSNTRHDPPAVLVNALRLGASTLLTPSPKVNQAVGGAVVDVAELVRVDPNDPAITQWRSVFPGDRWKPDEDRSPYPVQSALVLLAVALGLGARRTRGYTLAVLGGLVLTAAVVKWQDWGNRLILPGFAVAAPLAGYFLERALRGRVVAATLTAVVLAGGVAHGYAAVLYGQPRRLVGEGSVFTLDDWQERFVRQPDQARSYRTAIDQVRASGARRVGLVMDGDLWEYPIQIELRDKRLVELASDVPSEPAGNAAGVEAVICVGVSEERCRGIVPAGWRYTRIDQFVATAFPPG